MLIQVGGSRSHAMLSVMKVYTCLAKSTEEKNKLSWQRRDNGSNKSQDKTNIIYRDD